MNDKLNMTGIVEYKVTRADGTVETKTVTNQIQNLGLAAIASLIAVDNPQTSTAFDYIAVGTGTGQGVADTTLASEITTLGGARRGGGDVVATSQTTTITNDTIQFQTTFTFTGSLAITEAGILNAASAGVLLAYQDFSVMNVSDGDSLQVTWKISLA